MKHKAVGLFKLTKKGGKWLHSSTWYSVLYFHRRRAETRTQARKIITKSGGKSQRGCETQGGEMHSQKSLPHSLPEGGSRSTIGSQISHKWSSVSTSSCIESGTSWLRLYVSLKSKLFVTTASVVAGFKFELARVNVLKADFELWGNMWKLLPNEICAWIHRSRMRKWIRQIKSLQIEFTSKWLNNQIEGAQLYKW